jgi:pimeloyl-ACP methyl ester carboxylesterase
MKRGSGYFLCVFLSALLALALMAPAIANAAATDTEAGEDLYSVTTADGIELVIKHYLPAEGAPYRTGAQPVILMPGLLCNNNFYEVRTPRGASYDGVKLPEDLPDWAEGDPYIEADPMKFYSLAYYLWDQGYDVWTANYRGEGRDEMRCGGAGSFAIDELGANDMPAIVAKVRELTGQKPVWVGHSMGSTMAYMYLQGARFADPTNTQSKIVSDPALVAERNGGEGPQALKALVDLDGPVIPGGSIVSFLRPLVFMLLGAPIYIDLRPLTANFGYLASNPMLALQSLLAAMSGILGLIPGMDIFNIVRLINPGNISGCVSNFFFQFGVDGVSARVLTHFADAITYRKLREDWHNAPRWGQVPPAPKAGDGYYYYSDNLAKISLPALVIADATKDITNPGDIKSFYDRKSRHPMDRYYVIPGTAHVDLVIGLNAPLELFPKIGAWLAAL